MTHDNCLLFLLISISCTLAFHLPPYRRVRVPPALIRRGPRRGHTLARVLHFALVRLYVGDVTRDT